MEKTIKCPICDIGFVKCAYTPMTFRREKQFYGTQTSSVTKKTEERYEVLENCPNCGKRKEEIQKVLGGNDSKPPSREEILRRMREAGLDTKFGKKTE